MKARFSLALCIMLLLGVLPVKAEDFTVTLDGQRLYFSITSKSGLTAEVTYAKSIKDKNQNNYLTGVITVPAKVRHEGKVYNITAIGKKAFANTAICGISIPNGITEIKDFAFEGCDSLTNVIFPGNPVKFGEGVFFKCKNIENVTIGSDWTEIDFTMFRWSNRLTSVSIPAKIEKIKGLSKIKSLESVSVDRNNMKFSAYEGILYNKDATKLYGCPRAYSGKVTVVDGCEEVIENALINCVNVTALDLPVTLKSISFQETSRMADLEYIVLRSENPIMTAYQQGKGKFLFLLCRAKDTKLDGKTIKKTEIVIPNTKGCKDRYEKALATQPGEYAATPGGVPIVVTPAEMPTKDNFKAVKNFDKY